MQVEAILPDGRTQVVSYVSDFNFNWMTNYIYDDDAAPAFPKGTIIHVTAYNDNTKANKSNPDPDQWVGYGDRTVDEMAQAWPRQRVSAWHAVRRQEVQHARAIRFGPRPPGQTGSLEQLGIARRGIVVFQAVDHEDRHAGLGHRVHGRRLIEIHAVACPRVEKSKLHARVEQRRADPAWHVESLADAVDGHVAEAREPGVGHCGADARRIGGLDGQRSPQREATRIDAAGARLAAQPRDPATRVVGLASAKRAQVATALAAGAQIHDQRAIPLLHERLRGTQHRRTIADDAVKQHHGVPGRTCRRDEPALQGGRVGGGDGDGGQAGAERGGHLPGVPRVVRREQGARAMQRHVHYVRASGTAGHQVRARD